MLQRKIYAFKQHVNYQQMYLYCFFMLLKMWILLDFCQESLYSSISKFFRGEGQF